MADNAQPPASSTPSVPDGFKPDDPPAASWFWMKDSSGFPSVSVTFIFVSFWVTTLAYIASIVGKIGPFEFRPFDPGASASYFGMILGLYVARRYTDAKYGNPNVPGQAPPNGVGIGFKR